MHSFVAEKLEPAFTQLKASHPSFSAIDFPLSWGDIEGGDAAEYDWVPNIFDRSRLSELSIVPLGREEAWETIPYFADRFNPAQVLGLFPAFSQLATRFHRAIRSLPYPIPVANVAEERARVGVALIEPLRIEAVVTMQQGYTNFLEELGQHAAKNKLYYQIILHPEEVPMLAPGMERVFHEIHAVPGMPALYQCEHSTSHRDAHCFHPSRRFAWEFDGEDVFMTDALSQRFLRARLPLPFTFVEQSCPCGHPITLFL